MEIELDIVEDLEEMQALLELQEGIEDRERHLGRERREYKMKERINIDCWDDVDFHGRFRLTKPTVLRVLQIIEGEIKFVGTEER